MRKISCLLSLVALLLLSCGDPSAGRFHQHTAQHSGVHFVNTVEDNDMFNILSYEYLYNGGGVAIADFDRDGQSDIFFTGNMVLNQLYLNRGDFQFEEVSEQAGIGCSQQWSTGVSAVDINADGWMDLYVCTSTLGSKEKMQNRLFINQGLDEQGILRFEEMGEAYGIADQGYSTHAAFFDYDLDGDLDLYVLTNKLELTPNNNYRPRRQDGSAESTDRLYRNEGIGPAGHPVFSNVSKEAGILWEGFGLGIHIVDINGDDWPDIYVTNDYLSNDLLYINNADGTFSNRISEYIKHQSHSAMGNDIADLNNDGWPEVVSVEMLPEDNQRRKKMQAPNQYAKLLNNERYGYDFQYIRNMLYLNQGPTADGKVQLADIGCMTNTFATDWSWAPLLIDLDNDGRRDYYITNGFPKDITDMDFAQFRVKRNLAAHKKDILNAMPSAKIPNYVYQNQGNWVFDNRAEAWGLGEASFSNGAAFGDLDNDGDLDLVVNNINTPAFIYENRLNDDLESANHYLRIRLKGPNQNPQGIGARLALQLSKDSVLYEEFTPYRGYLSSVEPILHFGLGQLATIPQLVVTWPDGKKEIQKELPSNQLIELDYANAQILEVPKPQKPKPIFHPSHAIPYEHEELLFIDFNIQRTLPHQFSQGGPALAVGDIDGNGEEDLFIGGSFKKKGLFFLQKDGQFEMADRLPDQEQLADDGGALLFDADKDGDLDLYVVSAGVEQEPNHPAYQDRMYTNDGKGYFSLDTLALPKEVTSGSCVKAADFDGDGDLDLFVGGRVKPGHYPQAVRSQLLRNNSREGAIRFESANAELCPALDQLGLVSDALWTDYNNDQKIDLLIAGEWMPLTLLKNTGTAFESVAIANGLQDKIGWWNSLAAADFDQDGDMDYLAGNLGWNTFFKVNSKQPLTAYAGDFDKNGGYDVLLGCYSPNNQGEQALYPIHSRDDLIKQITKMKKRYLKFASYAEAQLPDLLSETEKAQALKLEANYLANSYIENLGPDANGQYQFAVRPLPKLTQTAPAYGLLAEDFNADGHTDVLMIGNQFGNDIFLGRYDASNGWLLLNDGKGTFQAQDYSNTNFFVPGDARSIARLQQKNGKPLILAAQNRDSLKVFDMPAVAVESLPLNPDDQWAEFLFEDGRVQKVEFYWGGTYYSQSSRTWWKMKGLEAVKVYKGDGEERVYKFK